MKVTTVTLCSINSAMQCKSCVLSFLIKETFGISYTLLFIKENCFSIPVILFSSPGRVLPYMGYIGTCREIGYGF